MRSSGFIVLSVCVLGVVLGVVGIKRNAAREGGTVDHQYAELGIYGKLNALYGSPPQREQLWKVTRGFVRNSLVSPSSARFPYLPEHPQVHRERTGLVRIESMLPVEICAPPNPTREQQKKLIEMLGIASDSERAQLEAKYLSEANSSRRWVVRSWVESKNAYGTRLRKRFIAYLLALGNSWRLEDLEMRDPFDFEIRWLGGRDPFSAEWK